jgi:hypothetical protein
LIAPARDRMKRGAGPAAVTQLAPMMLVAGPSLLLMRKAEFKGARLTGEA